MDAGSMPYLQSCAICDFQLSIRYGTVDESSSQWIRLSILFSRRRISCWNRSVCASDSVVLYTEGASVRNGWGSRDVFVFFALLPPAGAGRIG
eukprot:SAG31_NODE_19391_length_603_cov_2.291667_1_plen_92_part_01